MRLVIERLQKALVMLWQSRQGRREPLASERMKREYQISGWESVMSREKGAVQERRRDCGLESVM